MAFPQVGLQVILDIKQYQAQQSKLDKMLTSLTNSLKNVGVDITKAFVSPATRQALLATTQNLQTLQQQAARSLSALDTAMAQNLGTMEERAALQKIVGEADKEVGRAAKEAGAAQKQASSEIAAGLAGVAVVATAAVVAFTAVNKIIKESLDTFVEQAAELRRLQLMLAATSEETAAWAKKARDLGLGLSGVERAAGAFYRQIEAVRTAEAGDIEFTNAFTRAMDELFAGKDWKNLPLQEAFEQTVQNLAEMGNTAKANALALQVSGRFNKDFLVIVADSRRTFEEAAAAAQKYGKVAGPDQVETLRAYQEAHQDLNDAVSGFWTTLGEHASETMTIVDPILADLISKFRELYVTVFANTAAAVEFWRAIKGGATVIDAVAISQQRLNEEMQRGLWGMTAEEKAAEELAKADAAAAELAELAADKRQAAMKKEGEALNELNRKRQAALKAQIEGLENLARTEERAAIERGMRAGWEAEDTLRRTLERQQDLERDLGRRLEDIRRDQDRKQEDNRKQQQRKLEDLERAHQLRLIQIQLDYQDAVEEALRSNDAVAILAAMRTRRRAIRDEELKQKEQRETQRIEGERTREDQLKDYEQRRQDALRDHQQRLDDLRLAIQRETEEKLRQDERDRILRQMQHDWAVADIKRQFTEQLREADNFYGAGQGKAAKNASQMAQIAKTGAIQIGQQTAAGIKLGGTSVLGALSSWSQQYITLLQQNAQAIARIRNLPTPIPGEAMAEGGIRMVNQPTMFRAGEAGPEIAAFIPLRHTMSINHNFGNLGMTLNGQGVNASERQTEAIVWAILAQLPDILSGRR